MARILIVEDEPDMAEGLKDNFEYEGHEVLLAGDGEKGLSMAVNEQPDLIILDVMMPGKSGFEVCRELRIMKNKTPVIMLTAKGQEIDKVLGLELGADDYLTKPFSVRELLARVKAVLRRTEPDSGHPDLSAVQMGLLTVDFEHYRAWQGEENAELTHREFELLCFFYNHQGETIEREDLLSKVWGYDMLPTSRTVDNHILNLRKKIEPDPQHPRSLLTVHGIGYKYIQS